jgi:hypothetical protein
MMKGVIRLARTKLWKFADVELRDNTHVDASEFNHLGVARCRLWNERRAHSRPNSGKNVGVTLKTQVAADAGPRTPFMK